MAKTPDGGTRAARIGVGLAVGAMCGLVAVDLDLAAMVSFWPDSSWLSVVASLLFAAGWCTALRRPLAAVAMLSGALWLLVSYSPLVAWFGAGLVRTDAPSSADAVFVFASSIQKDGEPTTGAATRLLKGIELLAEGRASRIVVSEVRGYRSYAPIARDWSRCFVSREVELATVGPIVNSHDEAVAVARLCRDRGWRRVLAVTSPVHTRRACSALERAGLEVVCVPSIETRYDLETLDSAGDRRLAFAPILHERIGLWLYRRRGWVS